MAYRRSGHADIRAAAYSRFAPALMPMHPMHFEVSVAAEIALQDAARLRAALDPARRRRFPRRSQWDIHGCTVQTPTSFRTHPPPNNPIRLSGPMPRSGRGFGLHGTAADRKSVV